MGIFSDLIVIGSSLQIVDATTDKAYLPISRLAITIKSCFGTDDLRVLAI